MVALDQLRLLTTKVAENRQDYHTCLSIYSAHFARVGIVYYSTVALGAFGLMTLYTNLSEALNGDG